MLRSIVLTALLLGSFPFCNQSRARPRIFETLDGFDPAAMVRPSADWIGRQWLANAGFEEGMDGWRVVGEASVQDSGAHTGTSCCRLINPSDLQGDARLVATVVVPGGAAYRSSCFVRSVAGRQNFRIKWEVYVGDRHYAGFWSERTEFVNEEDGWTEIEFVQDLPPFDDVRVEVLFRLWSEGPLLLDSASFQMIPAPAMVLDDPSGIARLAVNESLAAWTAPFLTRVPSDFAVSPDNARSWRQGTLATSLAGRETGTLPLFLSAFESLEGVTVEVTELRPEGRPFELFLIEPFQYLGELRYDVLVPGVPFDMAANTTRMVWLHVTMPPAPERGDIEGVLRVSAHGRSATMLPFRFDAYDFDLPQFPAMAFCVGDPRPGRRVPAAERDVWRQEMAKRRMSTRHVTAPQLRFDGDTAVFDFTAFDEDVEKLLGMGMGLFQLPHTYVVQGHDKVFRQTFGPLALGEVSDEFRRRFVNAMRTFGTHLDGQGWIDRFNHNLWDEPYPRHFEQLRELAALLKQAQPRFRPSAYVSVSAVEQHIPGVVEEAITPASAVPMDLLDRLRERGDILSIYNPYHVFAVNRRPELVRGFMWWAWLNGFDRIYHWCIGPWRGTGNRPPGSQEAYGHCWVFENPGQHAFLPSVRFEAARAGSQDVDYLTLYEAAAAVALTAMGATGIDARTFVRPLVEPLAGERYARHSTHTALYERVRHFLGQEIARMSQPPLVLASARRDGDRLHVMLMAEPGARVEVNGAHVSASPGAKVEMSMVAGPSAVARVVVVSTAGKRKVLEIPLP